MKSLLRPTLSLFLLLSVLTGLVYPALVTATTRVLFPRQAAGSLLSVQGRVVGSQLIGQNFSAPGHFWGRPSATSPQPYNGLASGGSNLGPSNPALIDTLRARVAALRAADPGQTAPIPVDLVSSSASGLDPEISPAAALYQVPRIARATGLDAADLRALVARHTIGRTAGILGAPRVNVLALNLELEQLPRQK